MASSEAAVTTDAIRYTLWQLVRYFLRLGAMGFGGPVALVGYMRRDLVERLGWVTEADYREGLALAQLAPGPMAAQTAIYLGYVHYRVRGATLAGIAFVLPSFFMVVALGWAYREFGGLSWMQAVFYGVGAAVIGIIAISAHKLSTKSLGKDKLLWAIFGVLASVTVITESEIAWLFLAAGVANWLWRAPPKSWGGGGLAAALPLVRVAAFFQLSDGAQVTAAAALRGAGDTRTCQIANVVGHYAIGLPLALGLGFGAGWGTVGIWWGLSAGLTSVAITLTLRFHQLSKRPIARA